MEFLSGKTTCRRIILFKIQFLSGILRYVHCRNSDTSRFIHRKGISVYDTIHVIFWGNHPNVYAIYPIQCTSNTSTNTKHHRQFTRLPQFTDNQLFESERTYRFHYICNNSIDMYQLAIMHIMLLNTV